MKKAPIICIIILISLTSTVLAESGLSPGSHEILFKPNTEHKVEFTVYGYKSAEFENACPDLITINKEDIKFYDGSFKFYPIIKFPEKIDTPGKRGCSITVKRKLPENYEGIGAITQVAATIYIDVPYPGKYAEIKLDVQNINKGKPLNINLNVVNRGQDSLHNIQAKLVIKNYLKEVVGTFYTNATTLESGESESLSKTLNSSLYDIGKYSIEAIVDYGGEKPAIARANFIIGTKYVNFVSITNTTISPVMRFYLDIESWWGNPLENVYANVLIYNKTASGSFKTVSLSLKPWDAVQLYGFMEKGELGPGIYNANISLNYDGESSDFHRIIELKSEVVEKEKSILDILKLIATSPITVVIVIALIIVFDLLWLRKKKRNLNKGKRK